MGTTVIYRDTVLGVSLVLSIASLVVLFGLTWYFQSSLNILQQEVESDRKLLLELQNHVKVHIYMKIFSNLLLLFCAFN